MTIDHRHFEINCVLAASGQLADREFVELTNHLRGCDVCQNRLIEMAFIGSQLALARKPKVAAPTSSKGLLERFAARAASEGIQLKPTKKTHFVHNLAGAAILALLSVLLLAVSMTAAHKTNWAKSAPPTVSPQITRSASGADRMTRPIRSPKAPANATRHSEAKRGLPSYHRIEVRQPGIESRAETTILPETTGRFEQHRDAEFTLGSTLLSSSRPSSFEVGISSGSRFNPDAGRIEALFLNGNHAALFEKRVFSYDPRVASLNLVDSLRMSASTLPSGSSNQVPLFRFTMPSNQ
jgi:hypothetical protein